MSVPSMEKDIMGSLTPATEPQLNIMHATYLLMQYCSQPSAADVAKQFSSALHLKYFSEDSTVIIVCYNAVYYHNSQLFFSGCRIKACVHD